MKGGFVDQFAIPTCTFHPHKFGSHDIAEILLKSDNKHQLH